MNTINEIALIVNVDNIDWEIKNGLVNLCKNKQQTYHYNLCLVLFCKLIGARKVFQDYFISSMIHVHEGSVVKRGSFFWYVQ